MQNHAATRRALRDVTDQLSMQLAAASPDIETVGLKESEEFVQLSRELEVGHRDHKRYIRGCMQT